MVKRPDNEGLYNPYKGTVSILRQWGASEGF